MAWFPSSVRLQFMVRMCLCVSLGALFEVILKLFFSVSSFQRNDVSSDSIHYRYFLPAHLFGHVKSIAMVAL